MIPMYMHLHMFQGFKKLEKEERENIRNKVYVKEELKEMYSSILADRENEKTTLIYDSILSLTIFGFMAYYGATQIEDFAVPSILMSLIFWLMTVAIFYLGITARRRSFTKLVKKYYPDICDEVLS